MARSKSRDGGADDGVISIVGPDMTITGDLSGAGSVRIEGAVQGDIHTEKAVVVGKDGEVEGDIRTQDAIVSGRVNGSLTAASRLEVQATARIDGDVHARRIQLEEGAMLNGTVRMSEDVSLEARSAAGVPPPREAGEAPSPEDSSRA